MTGTTLARTSVACHPGCYPMCWQRAPDPLVCAHMCSTCPTYPLQGDGLFCCTLARATQVALILFRVYLMGITVPPCPDWLAAERVFSQQLGFRPTLLVADLYSVLLPVHSLHCRSVGLLTPPCRYAICVKREVNRLSSGKMETGLHKLIPVRSEK